MITPSQKKLRSSRRRFGLRTATVAVTAAALVGVSAVPASGYKADTPFEQPITASLTAAPGGAYWTKSDHNWSFQTHAIGGTFVMPGKLAEGSKQTVSPAEVAARAGTIVSHLPTNSYYIVTLRGYIARFGTAGLPALWDREDLVAQGLDGGYIADVALTPSGNGMWVLRESGAVLTLGDAVSYDDAIEEPSSSVAIVPTPTGRGYYILNADGGVHGRGDAEQALFGSTGGDKLDGKLAVGMALSYDAEGDVNGYWLVDERGGVYSFGDAQFNGSTGGTSNDYVTDVISLPGNGYAIVHENGSVEEFTRDPATGQNVWRHLYPNP